MVCAEFRFPHELKASGLRPPRPRELGLPSPAFKRMYCEHWTDSSLVNLMNELGLCAIAVERRHPTHVADPRGRELFVEVLRRQAEG